jgi:predicted ATP-binding protein involved in virulence
MYIEKVVIENIRSIGHFEMTFPNPAGWHVIIGDNGSGKTSALQGIALAMISDKLESFFPNSLVRQGSTDDSFCLINDKIITYFINDDKQEMMHVGKNEEKINNFTAGYGSLRITHEIVEFPQIEPSPNTLQAYSTLIDGKTTLKAGHLWLRELYIQQIDIESTSANERNMASKLLNKIVSLINVSHLLPTGIKLEKVNRTGIWFIDDKGIRLSLSALSDGFRSILNITIDIIYRMVGYYGEQKVIDSFGEVCNLSGIILIDEIDAHLHPTWQTRIGQWFTTYFPNIQFIVTTHSPLVCRACEKGSIWRLAAPGNNSLSREIVGIEKDRLIYGNILDAYGTEVFGASPVRSEKSNEKL